MSSGYHHLAGRRTGHARAKRHAAMGAPRRVHRCHHYHGRRARARRIRTEGKHHAKIFLHAFWVQAGCLCSIGSPDPSDVRRTPPATCRCSTGTWRVRPATCKKIEPASQLIFYHVLLRTERAVNTDLRPPFHGRRRNTRYPCHEPSATDAHR